MCKNRLHESNKSIFSQLKCEICCIDTCKRKSVENKNKRDTEVNKKKVRFSKPLHSIIPNNLCINNQVDNKKLDEVHRMELADKRCYENTLSCQLAGMQCYALVDTGATLSCVSKDLLQKISPQHLVYESSEVKTVRGVGNVILQVTDKVTCDIKISDLKFRHTFHVLNHQFPIILGTDFLQKHNAIVNFNELTVTLDGVKCHLQSPPKRSCLVRTLSDVWIPAYTSMNVPVKLGKAVNGSCYILEELNSFSKSHPQLKVALSIVNNQRACCRVTNGSDTPIDINSITSIAIARAINEHDLVCITNIEECEAVLAELHADKWENSQVSSSVQGTHVNNQDESTKIQSNNVSEENKSIEDFEFKIENPDINKKEAEDFIKFLKSHKSNFGSSLANLGHCKLNPMNIKITDQSKLPHLRYYKTSPKIQRVIDAQINELLEHGLIKPSSSEITSPIIMVPKKTPGEYRLAVDYRRLNSITVARKYPVPLLTDLFDI